MPSRKPVGHRAAKSARRLMTAITAVIALLVTAIPATATQCEPDVDCIGTRHDDELYGTKGRDRIVARAGDDVVIGRAGPDDVYGGKGADRLEGGNGADDVEGNGGDDVLLAGPKLGDHRHEESLYGGAGDDEIRSDGDGDWMEGGAGDDSLYGTKLRQRFEGGAGDDTLYGRSAVDEYLLDSARSADWWGRDVIVDGGIGQNGLALPEVKRNPPDVRVNLVARPNRPEVKLIGGRATVNWKGNTIGDVSDGSGDDTILGNADGNGIWLDDGKDTVFARAGDDRIRVGRETPRLPDTINCGPGHDRVSLQSEDKAAPNCEYVFVWPS